MVKKPSDVGMLEPFWSETGLLCQVCLLVLNTPFMHVHFYCFVLFKRKRILAGFNFMF